MFDFYDFQWHLKSQRAVSRARGFDHIHIPVRWFETRAFFVSIVSWGPRSWPPRVKLAWTSLVAVIINRIGKRGEDPIHRGSPMPEAAPFQEYRGRNYPVITERGLDSWAALRLGGYIIRVGVVSGWPCAVIVLIITTLPPRSPVPVPLYTAGFLPPAAQLPTVARARESPGLAEISEPRFSEKKSLLAPGRYPRAVVKLTVGGFWEIVINLRPHKLGVIDRGLSMRAQDGAPV